jgi:predicted nucleotidyltransferase component of viral defense system
VTRGPQKNVGASVRDRLTQRARAAGENVQLILTRYAIERLLYRLSLSAHSEKFVLKGAMLFSLWSPTPYRATGDLDLLGMGDPAATALIAAFRDVLQVEAADDGVTFLPETLRAEPTRPQDEYAGVRVLFDAMIAGARLPIQVDVGFGDAVTPAAQQIEYPSLLGMPTAKLKAYPPETVVAEKLEALVSLGVANSRMKDFFDLWAISQTFAFEGTVLARAIKATFERRTTALPAQTPFGLSEAFAADPAKQVQWLAFLRRTEIALAPEPLSELIPAISAFLTPVLRAAHSSESPPGHWPSGGPWRE